MKTLRYVLHVLHNMLLQHLSMHHGLDVEDFHVDISKKTNFYALRILSTVDTYLSIQIKYRQLLKLGIDLFEDHLFQKLKITCSRGLETRPS